MITCLCSVRSLILAQIGYAPVRLIDIYDGLCDKGDYISMPVIRSVVKQLVEERVLCSKRTLWTYTRNSVVWRMTED